MGLRESVYDVNATIFGSLDDRAVLGLNTQFSGVLSLVNPNGDEHYIYPSAGGLSAGNKTLMNTGADGVLIVTGPITPGPILDNLRAPGLNIIGSQKVSGLVTIGGIDGVRGAIGFLTGAAEAPRLLYFTDAHVPQLGSTDNWKAGTGGTALGAAVAGPFSKVDIPRDAVTAFSGPVIIAGRQDKPSGLGFVVGDGMTATMVWTTSGTALVAGSPATFYAL
jgi:hypothetical protein